MLMVDPQDVQYRYFINALEWKEGFKEELGSLLWLCYHANIVGQTSNGCYRPIVTHIRDLGEAYGVKDVPPIVLQLSDCMQRGEPDMFNGDLKSKLIKRLIAHTDDQPTKSFGLIARILDSETIPYTRNIWTPDILYRAPGITPMNEISKIPLTEYFFSSKKTTDHWVMDVDFVRAQCITKVNSSRSALLGLQKFLTYFRDMLDESDFSHCDLLQFCLVTDLLYLSTEIRLLNERHPDILENVIDQVDVLLSLATLGIKNVSC